MSFLYAHFGHNQNIFNVFSRDGDMRKTVTRNNKLVVNVMFLSNLKNFANIYFLVLSLIGCLVYSGKAYSRGIEVDYATEMVGNHFMISTSGSNFFGNMLPGLFRFSERIMYPNNGGYLRLNNGQYYRGPCYVGEDIIPPGRRKGNNTKIDVCYAVLRQEHDGGYYVLVNYPRIVSDRYNNYKKPTQAPYSIVGYLRLANNDQIASVEMKKKDKANKKHEKIDLAEQEMIAKGLVVKSQYRFPSRFYDYGSVVGLFYELILYGDFTRLLGSSPGSFANVDIRSSVAETTIAYVTRMHHQCLNFIPSDKRTLRRKVTIEVDTGEVSEGNSIWVENRMVDVYKVFYEEKRGLRFFKRGVDKSLENARISKSNMYEFMDSETCDSKVFIQFKENLYRLINGLPSLQDDVHNAKSDRTVKAEIVIPTGSFMMGDKDDPEASPVHKVEIQSFKMMENEVTYNQWNKCVREGPCKKIVKTGGFKDYGGNYPVQFVGNAEIEIFIGWLNRTQNRSYRLPSEAEWEYAARAGTSTAYSWGNDSGINKAACSYCGKKNSGTLYPVGSFAPNPWGLFDMHGNIAEWTADCYHRTYEGAPVDGSAWTKNCYKKDSYGKLYTYQVTRGGNYSIDDTKMTSAKRDGALLDHKLHSRGFRLVVDIE